jgi:hypothetical protein
MINNDFKKPYPISERRVIMLLDNSFKIISS